jgi:hypothetical protein
VAYVDRTNVYPAVVITAAGLSERSFNIGLAVVYYEPKKVQKTNHAPANSRRTNDIVTEHTPVSRSER